MSGISHFACGYSAFAPGCDALECLAHRAEVAQARGWDGEALRSRLDARITAFVEAAIGQHSESFPVRPAGASPHLL